MGEGVGGWKYIGDNDADVNIIINVVANIITILKNDGVGWWVVRSLQLSICRLRWHRVTPSNMANWGEQDHHHGDHHHHHHVKDDNDQDDDHCHDDRSRAADYYNIASVDIYKWW